MSHETVKANEGNATITVDGLTIAHANGDPDEFRVVLYVKSGIFTCALELDQDNASALARLIRQEEFDMWQKVPHYEPEANAA